jgi:succinate dehydrogenase / fumarate reductase iron-sulfur subunit
MMRNITVNHGLNKGKGPEHAEAFLTDMRSTGRLNEMKMALRTEGVTAMTRVGLAANLLRHGKVHPTELLGNDPIKGQADLVRILDLAKADAKGKE